MVDRQPVAGNLGLRLLKAEAPAAHLIVQIVLDLVLLVESRTWRGRFRPQIGDGVRAAQLEADEVVDLVLPGSMRADAVLQKYTPLGT